MVPAATPVTIAWFSVRPQPLDPERVLSSRAVAALRPAGMGVDCVLVRAPTGSAATGRAIRPGGTRRTTPDGTAYVRRPAEP
ncbi:MAG: hypothetical protein QOI74_328 [Micromonosporaceae bacterium]|nr:hypothetical protein [Micromonosporaceae bacterium]